MENIKLLLEYDGTDFAGWQIQPNGPTIQGKLENALFQILQERVTTVSAGRTDAGVHARGQVTSFKTTRHVEPQWLVHGLNGVLPSAIVVLSAETVPETFHARNSAKTRVYRYFLSRRHTALLRNYSWYVGGYKLNNEVLDQCARDIVIQRDFASFCKAHSDAESYQCSVGRAAWSHDDHASVFEIQANRFLYGMVRALVGTMVEIARGVRDYDDFARIFEARDRKCAGMAAPAKGLFLEEIRY